MTSGSERSKERIAPGSEQVVERTTTGSGAVVEQTVKGVVGITFGFEKVAHRKDPCSDEVVEQSALEADRRGSGLSHFQ